MTFLELVPIITVLGIVQSIFGMGLLVFGTPTLLLLGVSYAEILGILLPSSIALSCIQILTSKKAFAPHVSTRQIVFVVPFIIFGLAASLAGRLTIRLELVVSVMLLIGAVIRLSTRVQSLVYAWIRKQRMAYLAAMGLLHGLSNMGGSLLAIYASSVTAEKLPLRYVIARFYLVFGVTQLCVLLVLNPADVVLRGLYVVPLAVLAHILVGAQVFNNTSERNFQHAVSVFTGLYGISLFIKYVMLN